MDSALETTAESLPWALADRLIEAQVQAQVLGEVLRPTILGRYHIERPLGAGAMGQLLLAFDPDLRRKVALKLITPAQADSPQARRRIVQEARAMAQLSDPYVAQVYEVGEAQGQLFVAIEYVDGDDLRAWLGAAPRRWPEIVAIFRQAGAGLAAAHDAGIIHRDFKPDNVMLERDGRARVVDFGLAFDHQRRNGDDPGALADDPPRTDIDDADRSGATLLTRTGLVVGTPAYIAPEQWDGADADARSDQFAFCVALYEALAGRRPFAGETAEQIQKAQQHGAPARPDTAPGWIGRVLLRGLALDPAARWPDMRALLQALDPARRRRRWGAVAVTGVLATSVGLASRSTEDRCAHAGAVIDSDWGPAQQESLRRAAAEADAAWGPTTATRLLARLDAHAQAWRSAATGSCATAHSEDPASAECLREARRRLTDAVQEASSADPALWVSAVARAELWPDPRACADAPGSSSVESSGSASGSALRQRLMDIERNLGATSVRTGATSFVDATAAARASIEVALTDAEALAFDPLLARTLWLAGRTYLGDGQIELAEQHFRRALVVARRAADAPLAAAITTELVYVVARTQERFRESQDLADEAAGMIAALGHPPLLDARLRSHRASALAHSPRGDHAQAVELHEQAVELLVDTLGEQHPVTIVATGNLGAALNYAGRPADAEARLSEALASARVAWGEDHPRTALLMGTVGFARMRQRDLEGAEQHLRRSLEIREATLGPDHAQVDDARYNLAMVLRRRDRHAQALQHLEVGLEHAVARMGPDDPRLGPWWVATGESSLAVGDHPRAVQALDAAIRNFERTGASARDYARVRLGLARALAPSEPALARVFAEQALASAREADSEHQRAEIEAFIASLDR